LTNTTKIACQLQHHSLDVIELLSRGSYPW